MDDRTRELERRVAQGDEASATALLRQRSRGPSRLIVKCSCREGFVASDTSRARHRALRDRNVKPYGSLPRVDARCPRCEALGCRVFSWKERIDLAAYCGDRRAQAILGRPGWTHRDVQSWLDGLHWDPREVTALAGLALARAALKSVGVDHAGIWALRSALESIAKAVEFIVLGFPQDRVEDLNVLASLANLSDVKLVGHALEVCTSPTEAGRHGHLHSIVISIENVWSPRPQESIETVWTAARKSLIDWSLRERS